MSTSLHMLIKPTAAILLIGHKIIRSSLNEVVGYNKKG